MGVGAGAYTLEITDVNGCSSFINATLTEPDTLQAASTFVSDATCGGECDGSANVNIIGGTLPYSYQWFNGAGLPMPGATQDSIANQCAGSYSVMVTDANGCTLGPIAVTINEPSVITATFNVTDANCGVNDGAAEVFPTGGTGPYTFLWTDAMNGALIPGNAALQPNLGAGIYSVTITDAVGCDVVIVVTVSNINAPNIAIDAITDVSCFGECDGAVDVTVTAGAPPYTYLWQQGPFTTEDLVNVCPGTYILQVTDAMGCIRFDSATVSEPVQITASVSTVESGCGVCNGSATITPLTGVAPFTFVWSNGGSNATENNLCAGSYSVDVTDATGCTETVTVIINSATGPTGETVVATPASCFGACDGTVDVTPIGGLAPYTFSWTHDGSTSSSLTGLCAGLYFVEITDANGCVRIGQALIDQPTEITDSTLIVPPTCGMSDGSISLNVLGGTPPYTLNWNAPLSGGSFNQTNVASGVYTVDVTDAVNCTQTLTITVPSVTSPVIVLDVTDASCYDVCDGSITATPTGSGPFTFDLLDAFGVSTGNTTGMTTGLCPGDYIYQVTDVNGCVGFANATINNPDSISFNLPVTFDVSCGDVCDGVATVIPNGGTLPYTFSWSPSNATEGTALNLCVGTQIATVTDANGCVATQEVVIGAPTPITITIDSIQGATCITATDGSISITPAGGTGSLSPTWTGPNGFLANTEDIDNLAPGDYIITLSDAQGCDYMDTITVDPLSSLMADAGPDTIVCALDTFFLFGAGGTTYEWFDTAGVSLSQNDSLLITPTVGTTTYILQATDGQCTDFDTVVVTVNPLPDVDAGQSGSFLESTVIQLGGDPTGPAGATFSWSPTLNLDDSTAANPNLTVETIEIYTVFVTSPDGCVNSDTVSIRPLPDIVFPSGFTPNGDGVNDTWQIDLISEYPDATVEIFNRWGQSLFFSTGYQTPWDGTYEGKAMPVGTYYYTINLNDELFPDAFTGPLTILR